MTRARDSVCPHRSELLTALIGGACLLAGGCASAPAPKSTAPTATSPPEPQPAVAAPSSTEQLTRRLPDGRLVVSRPALRRLQDRGPHWMLARVDVRPLLKRGRFVGWRIVRYAGPGQLDPGDVVLRVNGNTLERPEQFMQAWTELPVRDKLVIELVQQGKPRTLELDVVDP